MEHQSQLDRDVFLTFKHALIPRMISLYVFLMFNFFKCTKPYVFSTSLPFPNQHGSNEKVKPFSILKFHLVYSRIYDLLLVRTYVSNWKEFLKFVLKEFLAMMIFKIDTYHSKLIVYCIHLLNNKQKVREETLMYPSLDQSVSKHTSRSGGGEQSWIFNEISQYLATDLIICKLLLWMFMLLKGWTDSALFVVCPVSWLYEEKLSS